MGNRASRTRTGWHAQAVRAVHEVLTRIEVDHWLSRLTWGEVGLAAEAPTPLDRAAGRRRNRFAALRPELTVGRPGLRRATRVRALTYLLGELCAMRAQFSATGHLTVAELTRACQLFGGDPGALGGALVAAARPSGPGGPAMMTALTREEERLARALAVVRRAPDPVPPLTAGQLRQLSFRQTMRLWAAERREERERLGVVLGALLLAAVREDPTAGDPSFYETNPPRA